MPSKYIKPIKVLGTSAIIAFAIALLFPVISNALLSDEARKAVLVNAIPFFAAFVGILLLFILLIFMVAIMLVSSLLVLSTGRPKQEWGTAH